MSPHHRHPRRGRARPSTRRACVALSAVLVLSPLLAGCLLAESSQYLVDAQPSGRLYVHLFQAPTFGIVVLHDVTCNRNIDCTIAHLREQTLVTGPAAAVWSDALNAKDELATAISVSRHSYDPTTGSIDCLMIYSVWTTGWGNSSNPDWCRHG